MDPIDSELDRGLLLLDEHPPTISEDGDTSHEVIDRREDGQSILQTIIVIVGGIVLVILLVLLGRWIYHKVHHNTGSSSVGISSQPAQPNSSASNQPAATPQPSTSSGSASSPAPSNKSSGTSSNLPNSGPGDIAAIFAGSTLAAAGLHYIIGVRRFNKNNY